MPREDQEPVEIDEFDAKSITFTTPKPAKNGQVFNMMQGTNKFAFVLRGVRSPGGFRTNKWGGWFMSVNISEESIKHLNKIEDVIVKHMIKSEMVPKSLALMQLLPCSDDLIAQP